MKATELIVLLAWSVFLSLGISGAIVKPHLFNRKHFKLMSIIFVPVFIASLIVYFYHIKK